MKELLKQYLPETIINILRYFAHPGLLYERYQIFKQPKVYKRIIKKNKKQIYKVAFFVTHSSVWKYDYLYYLMQEHERFDPIVVICPIVNYGRENMLMEMERSYNLFTEKGYNVVCAYDVVSDTYMDIKAKLEPDIIFYTNPYKGLIDRKYYIDKFLDKFTCYVPYSASICSEPSQFKLGFYSLLCKFYLENTLSQQIAKKEMKNNAWNTQVVGFPALDAMFNNSIKEDTWRHNQQFKIIWAPHHSFDDECSVHFSNFLQISDSMLKIRDKYKKDIQIAFNPHPLLYIKLLNLWGEEKTDDYFQNWAKGDNSQYEDGEYVDLFKTSDAMIFDSISFIYEYLYTQKPSLFIYNNNIDEQLNDFGKAALKCHQFAVSVYDIENFILQVINQEPDPLLNRKKDFYQKNIQPSNAQTASENILMNLLSELS